MAVIALVAANVSRVQPQTDEVYGVTLTEAVTVGQVLYQLTTGKFGIADADVAGKQQARGIALAAGAAGQTVPMLVRGLVGGFTVSSLNADVQVFLSDTAGALDTSAGTMNVVCGRVFATPDGTKILRVDFDWLRAWS
jgi:hypothetical protein